jgi:hypothetical protein
MGITIAKNPIERVQMITGAQLRAARAYVKISAAELAEKAARRVVLP